MSPEEQVEYEQQVAKVLEIRGLGPPSTSTLSTWLNSAVLATLIGVVGTGVLGAWVTGLVQDRSKENELARAAQEERLTSQNTLITKVLDRVGALVSSTDDLLATVNNVNTEEGRPAREVSELQEWKLRIRKTRDDADAAWRNEKRSLGYSPLYQFDNHAGVDTAWRSVIQESDTFEQCTRGWYTQNAAIGTDLSSDRICMDERQKLESAIESLLKAVVASRSASSS
jgi:hypothetical protein